VQRLIINDAVPKMWRAW